MSAYWFQNFNSNCKTVEQWNLDLKNLYVKENLIDTKGILCPSNRKYIASI